MHPAVPHPVLPSCSPVFSLPCLLPLQDSFFKQLRTAPDGFSLVAEYFGRGLLNHTSVSTA
jgi:hypothetical protein